MKAISSLVVLAVLVLSVGCGDSSGGAADTPESISREILANMKNMAAIFNSITDEASAKAAIPKIEAARAKMRDIHARAQKVKAPSKEDEQKLEQNLGKEREETMGALIAARQRLETKPELLEIIKPALMGMENDMK